MGLGSFVQGFAGVSDEAQRNARKQRQLLKSAKKASSTDRFAEIADQIAPLIRELEAMGAIPAFQSAAATGVSRRGLTGTGIGTAITSAAGGAGELFALKQALGLSSDIQSRQLAAILGFAGVNLAGPSSSNLFGATADVIMQRISSGIASQGKNVQGQTPVSGTSPGPGGQQPFASNTSGIGSSSSPLGGTGGAGGGPGGFPGGFDFGALAGGGGPTG